MYNLVRLLALIIVKLLFSLQITGLHNLPENSAAVIASNHISYIDPVVIAIAIKRPIHFMAKQELFKTRFLKWFFYSINAFPVKRGLADRSAIRTGLNILAADNFLGIFPEGTRNKGNEKTLPIQSGAALLAIKGNVPIVPVVVQGTKTLKFRQKILVTIGEPIHLDEGIKAKKAELISVNNLILEQFAVLGKQEFD